MESFVATSGFGGIGYRQNISTKESEDVACDAATHNQHDSGICLSNGSIFLSGAGLLSTGSSTDCRFGHYSTDGIADRTTELEEQLRRMDIEQEYTVAHNKFRGFSQSHTTLGHSECGGIVSTDNNFSTKETLPWETRIHDPFQQDEDGDTQLHLSIIKLDACLAIRLIEEGQYTDRLDIQNDHLHTALHLAVITDQPQIVRALVVAGASLSVRDRVGNTPLHLACKLGHQDCVERLTAPPSEEEQRYVWQSSSSSSYRWEDLAAIRMTNYVRSNDISLLNYEGDTCLHLALSSAAESRINIINYLLNVCGADVNAQEGKCGLTLLHQAVRSKNMDTVQFLLQQRDVAINQNCYNGYTPLDIAISLNHSHLVQVLINAGGSNSLTVGTTNASDSDSSSSSIGSQDDSDFDDLMIAGWCAAAAAAAAGRGERRRLR